MGVYYGTFDTHGTGSFFGFGGMVSTTRKSHDTAVTGEQANPGRRRPSTHSLEMRATLSHGQTVSRIMTHTARVFWRFAFFFFPSRLLSSWTCGKDQKARSYYTCVGFEFGWSGLSSQRAFLLFHFLLSSRLTPTAYHPPPELMRVKRGHVDLSAGGEEHVDQTAGLFLVRTTPSHSDI